MQDTCLLQLQRGTNKLGTAVASDVMWLVALLLKSKKVPGSEAIKNSLSTSVIIFSFGGSIRVYQSLSALRCELAPWSHPPNPSCYQDSICTRVEAQREMFYLCFLQKTRQHLRPESRRNPRWSTVITPVRGPPEILGLFDQFLTPQESKIGEPPHQHRCKKVVHKRLRKKRI